MENAIVERAAAGDVQAWNELVRRYERLLRSVASGLRMRRCDADDAAQQTWLALQTGIHGLREPEHVKAWLCRVMYRQCLRILRAQRLECPDETLGERADRPVQAVDPVVVAETAAALWAAVDRLPERERQLLQALFTTEERSYREIARVLGMPVGAIGPVRMRALRRLPGLLAEAGLTVENLHAVA
jgi:RNA polymerase sigma factor (sigma-70 family)